jgi:hypothetical protein
MVLREFRDRYLMRSEFGRKVVWSYYRYSPPIAKFIETKPALRGLIRLMVKPMVNIAKAKLKNLSLKNKVLEKEGKAR